MVEWAIWPGSLEIGYLSFSDLDQFGTLFFMPDNALYCPNKRSTCMFHGRKACERNKLPVVLRPCESFGVEDQQSNGSFAGSLLPLGTPRQTKG